MGDLNYEERLDTLKFLQDLSRVSANGVGQIQRVDRRFRNSHFNIAYGSGALVVQRAGTLRMVYRHLR